VRNERSQTHANALAAIERPGAGSDRMRGRDGTCCSARLSADLDGELQVRTADGHCLQRVRYR
jgi:hypothetical protein